jgi:hypothetical protein
LTEALKKENFVDKVPNWYSSNYSKIIQRISLSDIQDPDIILAAAD